MVRVTCSSGYPSLSRPLVCLRWGCLIPLIALSLDGVFRGCFAVDFSPFLPFRWLVLPFSFFICKPRPVTTLVTISSLLVTFRVALHYVCPENYHVFFCHVTLLLNSNSWMELDSRLVEICRDSFALFC